MPKFITSAFLLLFMAVLTACQPASTPDDALNLDGDPVNGRRLATAPLLGETPAPGCRNCHSLEEGVVLVGPSFQSMSGFTKEYLLQGIVEPNAVLAEGYAAGNMYVGYGEELTPQQLADLIAFMQSLP